MFMPVFVQRLKARVSMMTYCVSAQVFYDYFTCRFRLQLQITGLLSV